MSHVTHASARNVLRQAAFLGQPHTLPPAGWNTSTNSESSRHQPEPTAHPTPFTAADAQPPPAAITTTAVDSRPMTAARNTAVVCRAVGLGRPQVPSLSLAALKAERHRTGLHTSHGQASEEAECIIAVMQQLSLCSQRYMMPHQLDTSSPQICVQTVSSHNKLQ